MSENPLEEVPLSILASDASLPAKTGKKCLICNKKFGLGKKYLCCKCQNYVCSRHSIKKYNSDNPEESQRICDICDMEQIRQDIKREILEELSKLKQNIDLAKESYKKVENNRLEKAKIVKELEEEILETEKKQKIKEEELQMKINEEFARTLKANEVIDSAKKDIEELYAQEKEMNQKCLENEEKCEQTSAEVLKLKEKRIEMLAQIEHLSGKLKGSLPKDQVLSILCENCKKKVDTENKGHLNEASSPQDDLDS